jgi:hypothetical protein
MLLHPHVIEKERRKEFVVLPNEEFVRIQEALEDFEDLRELRKEREESMDAPSRSLREIGKDLGRAGIGVSGPLGSDEFIGHLEKTIGRRLRRKRPAPK